MDTLTSLDFGFQLYNSLIKVFDKKIGAMLVFDRDGELIWQSEGTQTDLAQALKTSAELRAKESNDGVEKIFQVAVIDNRTTGLVRLKDSRDRLVLTVAFEIKKAADKIALNFNSSTLALLNQGLIEWYFASLRFARQEDELNRMTEELTRRYEELNLIYRAEDQVHSIYHGRELLKQLVENTPGIVSADLAVLSIPKKGLTIIKLKNDSPLDESEEMVGCLQHSIFRQLQVEGASLVINYRDEADRRNLEYVLPYKFAASPLVNGEGDTIGLFALVRKDAFLDFDNSDRNLLEVLAKKASKIVQYNFDPLTGLENIKSFELVLVEAIKKNKNANTNGVIAYVDIDGMAVVNDIAGRDGGNRLIKDVGSKIANAIRPGDTLARLGGDKFGVYLQDYDLKQARDLMRNIADQVKEIKFVWENKLHEVSISVGLAAVNEDSKSSSNLISAAESALEAGKKLGPDRVTLYRLDDGDSDETKSQVQWLGRIQAALKDNGYLLYSQLIEPLDSTTIRSHQEVLLRMLGDGDEIIPPSEFLPVAEKYQLMPKIDRWVISHTLEILGENFSFNEQRHFPVSINLSGQSLADARELYEFIETCFKQYRVDPAAICFEVTESTAIENLESAKWFISKVRDLGCKFALDDFGTGLSSFAYLKNLDVDFLKIDGSFVHCILTDKVCESMVSAINQVGHAMGIATVAEFVESAEIRDRLYEIGVDLVQGYSIGVPADFRRQIESYRKITCPDRVTEAVSSG